ncbi:MAG: cupredoxin domain-containing protein [Coriobacteriia bacterium]
MRRVCIRVIPFAMLVSALLWAGSAMAAPAKWQRVDVTLHSEQSGGVMLVSGELPESVKLPAEAELSVPAGSSLQWVGQILGGDPSADPELTYTKSAVDGSDVYRFTLTKSRNAQLEIVTSDAAGFDGTNYMPALKWAATQAVPEVRLNVRIPQSAQIVQAAPGAALQPGASGFSFYTKTVKNVKPGDQLDMAFSYQVAAAPASGASSASSGSTAQIVIVILAIGVGALVVLAVRRKMTNTVVADPAPVKASVQGARPKPQSSASAKGNGKSVRADAAPSASTANTEVDATDGQPARRSAATKRNLVTAVIIGSVIVIAMVVGKQTTKPQIEGDSISQTFSQGQPCSTATIALAVPAGADPAKTAETLFAALSSADGMNTAKYNFKTSTLEAGFCESSATEASVRQALAPTGMVDASAPAAAAAAAPTPAKSATAKPSGNGQALTVDTSSGSFSPSQLNAKAGKPIEITFGQGSGCLAEVVFPDLSIRQSLEGGPVTVKLPALKPGTYAFACGMDMDRGTLVVQ